MVLEAQFCGACQREKWKLANQHIRCIPLQCPSCKPIFGKCQFFANFARRSCGESQFRCFLFWQNGKFGGQTSAVIGHPTDFDWATIIEFCGKFLSEKIRWWAGL